MSAAYTTEGLVEEVLMIKRALGSLQVSEVGIGCNNFGARLDQDATTDVVLCALDEGINFFDTADIYGATKSEAFLGRALGSRRDEAVVATKFGMPLDDQHFGASPAYVAQACEDSLRRLGTDYIDLYQLHFPDDTVPIADTMAALHELIAQGKVREIGCSNLNATQLNEARASAGDGPYFVSVQNQYSLLAREPERDGVLDACDSLGLGFLPFYPLANGLLTGKVLPGQPIPDGSRLATMAPDRAVHWLSNEFQGRVGALVQYADEIEVPMLSLAFSWLLSHSQVSSVIAGASNPEQVRANAASVRPLTMDVVAMLNVLSD
jgi:aryl-alcohol dehydrogenase-like predicted oxidoreductase